MSATTTVPLTTLPATTTGANAGRPPRNAPAPDLIHLDQDPITAILQGNPGPNVLVDRCKGLGLVAPNRSHCGKRCAWKDSVTIVPHRDSLFSKATLPLWSLLVVVVQWLSGGTIANTARVTAALNAAVIRFGTKLIVIPYPSCVLVNVLLIVKYF